MPRKLQADSSKFDIYKDKKKKASISWSSIGEHSLQNGLASYLVCKSLGLKSNEIAEVTLEV
jgi:UDP-N-acetylmuramate-alanine ligase